MSFDVTIDTLREQMRAIEQSSSSSYFNDIQNEEIYEIDHNEGNHDEYNSDMCSSSLPSQSSHKKDAFSRIVGLVNASDKSEAEIRKRLLRADFPESEIDEAIDRAKRCMLIDDERFAQILIQSRIHQGWGSSGIERELNKNNIDPATINGWPYDYHLSDDAQFDRAFELLRRKPPRAKNLRESAYRKLVLKGYSSSIASQVAREWSTQATQGNL